MANVDATIYNEIHIYRVKTKKKIVYIYYIFGLLSLHSKTSNDTTKY